MLLTSFLFSGKATEREKEREIEGIESARESERARETDLPCQGKPYEKPKILMCFALACSRELAQRFKRMPRHHLGRDSTSPLTFTK